MTWAAGGTYLWNIAVADEDAGAGTGWSLLNTVGDLAITADPDHKFTLALVSLTASDLAGAVADFDQMENYSWLIADASHAVTGFDADAFEIDTSEFANAAPGEFFLSQSGNQIFLNYTPVPEPSTWALSALGLGALIFARRRALNQKGHML